ncbi:MAG: hypothetical protein M3O03_08610 [Pseudomonadota bacterium]|nr:hypothetical protein [Pseudomonadota bacterium]
MNKKIVEGKATMSIFGNSLLERFGIFVCFGGDGGDGDGGGTPPDPSIDQQGFDNWVNNQSGGTANGSQPYTSSWGNPTNNDPAVNDTDRLTVTVHLIHCILAAAPT